MFRDSSPETISGQRRSIKQLLHESARRGLDLYSGVPLDGAKVRKNLVIKFPKGLFSILTDTGPRDLGRLTFAVDVYATVATAPIATKAFSYTGQDVPCVYGVDGTTESFGKEVGFSMVKQEGSNMLHITITSEQPSKKDKDNRA